MVHACTELTGQWVHAHAHAYARTHTHTPSDADTGIDERCHRSWVGGPGTNFILMGSFGEVSQSIGGWLRGREGEHPLVGVVSSAPGSAGGMEGIVPCHKGICVHFRGRGFQVHSREKQRE